MQGIHRKKRGQFQAGKWPFSSGNGYFPAEMVIFQRVTRPVRDTSLLRDASPTDPVSVYGHDGDAERII
jgi:hypothetical protein